jgi:type IV pilus assembly protein PilW
VLANAGRSGNQLAQLRIQKHNFKKPPAGAMNMANLMTKIHKQQINKQHGFSLVEIMVGLVIGLIGTIVIFQVFAISEGQKRTTTAGNDANQNGIFALYTLERHLRMGGGGILNAENALGCLINASYENNVMLPAVSLPSPFNTLGANVRAAPLLIQNGGGEAPDNIIVMYGNSTTAGAPVAFRGEGNTATLSNTVGLKKGDIFLAASQFQVGAPEAPLPCSIGQMTSEPAAGDSGVIGLDSTGKHNASTGIITLGGQDYDGINLGNGGVLGFGVTSSAAERFELVSYNFLTGGASQPLADNIVNLQALYGLDNGAAGLAEDGIVDAWVPPTGNWSYASLTDGSILASSKLRKIKAVRLAVVARSALPEKREGGIPVTPANWTLFASGPGAGVGTVSGTLTANQQDYRYKIFETVIPLRNTLIQQCSIENKSRGFCNPIL